MLIGTLLFTLPKILLAKTPDLQPMSLILSDLISFPGLPALPAWPARLPTAE